jgi:hypothetical protein
MAAARVRRPTSIFPIVNWHMQGMLSISPDDGFASESDGGDTETVTSASSSSVYWEMAEGMSDLPGDPEGGASGGVLAAMVMDVWNAAFGGGESSGGGQGDEGVDPDPDTDVATDAGDEAWEPSYHGDWV